MSASAEVVPPLASTSINDNGAVPARKRIVRVDQIYSRKDRQNHLFKTSKLPRNRLPPRHALVIRRIIDARGLLKGVEIDIKSPKLAEVLKEIFRGAEKLMIAKSDESPVVSPQSLFLAWDALEERRTQESFREPQDDQLLQDISVALAYLHDDFGPKRAELKGLAQEGLITYELLGSMFTPNMVLYTDKNWLKEGQAIKFKSGAYRELQNGERFYALEAVLISHDGEDFGWGSTLIKLPIFEGKMKITSLEVFPFAQHPEEHTIRQSLVNRGRKFVDLLRKPACRWYGATAVYSQRQGLEWEELQFPACQRVMIDPPTWMAYNNSYDVLRLPYVKRGDTLRPELLRDEDLVFCNYRVLGFDFEEKRWGAFAVSKLKDPNWNTEAFDKVILPSNQLTLIKDLVYSHRARSETGCGNTDGGFDDIITGKGKGLIGLLSGGPGVGKTLTAEAVAEVSRRPLYPISAGELGTSVDTVDKKLKVVLDITHRWSCVLLIDEADVFLRKRDDDLSLERNAVVSVFLRRLEYFRGVAILTTNRKIDIDVAFMSRIHYRFHYGDLDVEARLKVWRNFMGAETSNPKGGIDENGLRQLAEKYTLSGREIKSAASCAQSISRARNQAPSLQLIIDCIKDFGIGPSSTDKAQKAEE